MSTIIHDTNGAVCAQKIEVVIDDASGKISDVTFYGGCPGNHAGLTSLVKGMLPEDVVNRLSGIRCGGRNSSCPDQLAEALKGALK